MVETAPQSLTESAHMVCLPQAACGQFHMSFWNRKPSWFQVPSPALDSQLGCCGIDANEAVAGTSRAVAAASRVKARFSIGLASPVGYLAAAALRYAPPLGTLQQ